MNDKIISEKRSDKLYRRGRRRLGSIWLDFKLMLLRWVGHIPSHTLRRAMYRWGGVSIEKGSSVHMWCNFFDPRNVSIGHDTIIGDHAFLDGRDKLTIGSHVALASTVKIYNSQHDIDDPDFKAAYGPVVIGDYVFIGPGAIILPGVTIGFGAVVGAGAVVTKDVDAHSVVGGVPARYIRQRGIKQPKYILGRARKFQ